MNENNRKSFLPLFVTNFFGVANDNFLKTLASFVLLGWVADERTRAVLMGITAAALVLPYILVSPLADRLTVLFPKCSIVRLAKVAELPIIALAVAGLYCHSISLTVGAIVLMGLQSALFSPAKYALVRDIGGEERISTGMGGMEGVSFLAVLGGTVAAAFVADLTDPRFGYAILVGCALCGVSASLGLRADEQKSHALHAISPLRFLRRARRMSKRQEGLPEVISTLCVFWAVAAMLQQGIIVYGTQVLSLDSTHTGALLVLAAVGIVTGQVTAGFVDRRHALIGWVPYFGILAASMLLALYAIPFPPVAFGCVLGVVALILGFFKLPLDAEIQRMVKGPRLNTILAYFNQISFLYMFAASILYAGISWLLGPQAFLLFIATALALAAIRFALGNRPALFLLGRIMLDPRYAVQADELPAGRTLLVLPNHPALVDPMLVISSYRTTRLRPLVDAAFFGSPIFARVLHTLDAVKVPDLRARHTAADIKHVRSLDGMVREALATGENILLYPSGHIYTENKEDIGNRQLAYTICRDLPPNVTVVGLRTRGLWGSMWSRKGRTASPSFALTLIKGILQWPFSPLRTRRAIHIHAEDLTDRVRAWSKFSRREFNDHLTAWYNEVGS
ncbi:MAG: MFS transporter [Kiritimatiellae bacterium]|nr:MFS transporter [Kiritimatiellia bacterium]